MFGRRRAHKAIDRQRSQRISSHRRPAGLVDVLLRHGVCEHLDGMFALAPAWASAIVKAADAKDWQSAAAAQRRLSALLRLLKQYGVLQTFHLDPECQRNPRKLHAGADWKTYGTTRSLKY